MVTAGDVTFSERDLFKQATVTITVVRGPMHRLLVKIGLWMMKVGARVAGVGNVVIEDGREG